LVEFAASAVVWAKLIAAPDASTAFDPAAPARPGGLMGGMPWARVVVAGAEADADADADGQGAAEAEAAGALPLATAAGALALAAATAGALAAATAGAGALALAAATAGALAAALALAEAQVPSADSATVVAPPPEIAMTTPKVAASATGMARGTAYRDARLLRRRGADRCSLSILIHLHVEDPCDAPMDHARTCASGPIGKFRIFAPCKGSIRFSGKLPRTSEIPFKVLTSQFRGLQKRSK